MTYLYAKDQNGRRLFVGDVLPNMIKTVAHIFADPDQAHITRINIFPNSKSKKPMVSIPRPEPEPTRYPDIHPSRCVSCGALTTGGRYCPTCNATPY